MRILVVSYFFPPIGGAGVQRNVRLASHLSELGVDLVVVTGTGEAATMWAPQDPALAAETSRRIAVHRISGGEPQPTPVRARLERYLRLDSAWEGWWRRGVGALGRDVGRGCDLVWAQMQPYASAHPVADLASDLGVPWVSDLADPWALDEMQIYPSGFHRRLEKREMRRALASCTGVVMNTPEAANRLVTAFPELRDRPLMVGPVGWERSDFDVAPPRRSDARFRVVHTGYLHTELGRAQHRSAAMRRWLGGSHQGVDILTRSHVYLLQAIDALVARRPELKGQIEIHLAGVQSAADAAVSTAAADVRMVGYVSHPEAVALMRSADLLFLPMHDLPPGDRATIVPGKTYEYLASGRPILAAVPDGDARDLLVEAGNAFICRPADVATMSEILSERIDAALRGDPPPAADPNVVERYEYSRLARDLGSFFEGLAV